MILYEFFFKRYGVRLPQHLMTPVISTMDRFQFPQGSIYHALSHDGVQTGPAPDDYLFRGITKQILMDHVLKLHTPKGQPRPLATSVNQYIQQYHQKNRRFRFVRDVALVPRDLQTLIVESYGLMSKAYKYTRSMYTEYYKWWNLENAMWAKANELALVPAARQQFIFVDVPRVLPSVQTLDLYSKTTNATMIKVFQSPESLFLLEIWKWLSEEHRAESTLAPLTPAAMNKINIVYREGNNWILVNLGIINSWRFVDGGDTGQKVKIDPHQLSKRFLRMLMDLMAERIAPVDIDAGTAETAEIPAAAIEDPDAHEHDDESRLEKANRILTTLDDDLGELAVIEKHTDVALQEVKPTFSSGIIDIQDFKTEETTEGTIVAICDKLAEDGMITAPVYKNMIAAAKTYKTITSPDGKSTLEEFIKIDPKDTVIDESPAIVDISTVPDKSMLKSSLLKFDETYIEKVLAKDVAGMVVNIQKAGVILSDYTVEPIKSILGDHEMHSITVRPVEGKKATLHFKLPVVDSEGYVTYNGNKYRMRKQRGDMPIRKIAPDKVALTSYYGKTFVQRSPKRVNNYPGWLTGQIMEKGLDGSDQDIQDLATGDFFDNSFPCPRVYSTLAMSFKSFSAGGYFFSWDHNKREEVFGKDALELYERDGMILIATDKKGKYLTMDKGDAIYENEGKNTTFKGTIETFLNIDTVKTPVEFSEIKIFGKNIPVGFILAYQMGLRKLISILKVQPREVMAGQRLGLEAGEYAITFSDMSLIFNKEDKLASMLLAGLNEYDKHLRKYNAASMDAPNVYLNILEMAGMGSRYLREIDLFTNLFVDPITRELLLEMGEPTNVRGLLVRATELLLTNSHPDQLDLRYMRIKGYERLAGAVYSELIQSIRAQSARVGKANAPLELRPFAVWKRIVQDPSMAMVSDQNPIENLKQMEAVTYSGIGGRSTRSMTKATRSYHDSDVGVISESTVDNTSVGVNIYTSADPQFKSVRGTTRPYIHGKTGVTAVLSTSALLSPGSDRDDPKRVNFIAIQHSHGVACSGYRQGYLRTGYEQVIAHRTSDMYAYTARQPGKVLSKTNTGLVIEYADGTKKGIEIGRRFGAAAGLVIPHNVVTELKAGDAFEKGDVISYNDGFFEKDWLNPKQVVWRVGVMANTVLMESNQTLEDASSISRELAGQLTTNVTKVKTIVVRFDQIIRDMVNPGDALEPESILCTIEDAVTSNSNLFDEDTLDTLKLLSSQAPTSKVRGVVERIEVFYNGDKEDMSDSLKVISGIYDKDLSSRYKAVGKDAVTGRVDSDLRIDGEPLMLDQLAIKFFITSEVTAGVGDKGVFCNQMKTVFSEVMAYDMTTESGDKIDAVFGQKSIADRIVSSPELIGTTGTLLDVIGKNAVELYRKK